ncbi:MAG: hypothetical protein P4L33_19045 [Capsulimonadaceae bacterium]|nr:hypothetical protein [Capsulimonadaceae bacterium]
MMPPRKDNPEGEIPEFARLVREAMTPVDEFGVAGRRMTARTAARITGISLGTINSMAHGVRPKASLLIKFAGALGAPATPLLAAAGYLPEAPLAEIKPAAEDAISITDPDEAKIVARYRNLPPDRKRMARRLLSALEADDNSFDGYDEGEGDPPPPSTRRA